MVWRASVGLTAAAAAPLGRSSTEPARMRLTLPSMKALGLACSMATSTWSSETLAGRLAMAMRPAVSPRCTVTWRGLSPLGDGAGAAARGALGAGARIGGGAAARGAAEGAGLLARGACVAGATGVGGGVDRSTGGSSSSV